MDIECGLSIESTRAPEGHGPACLLRWPPMERVVPVDAVRRTAEDLYTAAAYAEVLGVMLGPMGGKPELVTQLIAEMIRINGRRYLGGATTMFISIGGSRARAAGAVLLGRRSRFHEGVIDAALEPEEARVLARNWLQVAEASENDTLFSRLLERSGWLPPEEVTALFATVADIRADEAQLPPR